jgi:hypothetical protein
MTQRSFMAQLMRQYNATTESFIAGDDGWDQYTIWFPRVPDVRDNFIADFNASELFGAFEVRHSDSYPILYVEFEAIK